MHCQNGHLQCFGIEADPCPAACQSLEVPDQLAEKMLFQKTLFLVEKYFVASLLLLIYLFIELLYPEIYDFFSKEM